MASHDDMSDYLGAAREDFIASLPPRFRAATIASYALAWPGGEPRGDRRARDEVAEWAAAWPDADRGLYLYGGTGAGKTHLAIGALRAIAERDPAGLRFLPLSSHLDRRRRAGIEGREPYGSVFRRDRLVVLDDLGALKATDFIAEQVGLMIDALWLMRMPVIVTSNRLFGELTLDYGERAVSRLADLARRVDVTAGDDRTARAVRG